MTRPISTRERAAQLCSMAACSRPPTLLLTVCLGIGVRRNSSARTLAFAAVSYVVYGHGVSQDRYAEAESLLRSGWSPGGAP